MRTVLRIWLALVLGLGLLATLPSCGALGAALIIGDDGYYNDPFGYDPRIHVYDGYWHDGYVYWDGHWYYHGLGTPYDYYYPSWW